MYQSAHVLIASDWNVAVLFGTVLFASDWNVAVLIGSDWNVAVLIGSDRVSLY